MRFVRQFGELVLGTARDSLALFRLAIWIPLLVIVPEFIQHVVEIQLGMFESRDAFRELAMDPRRMIFGIVKVVGLIAAILAAAGYWARREKAVIAWRQVGIALAFNVAATLLVLGLGQLIPAQARQVVDIVLFFATLPLLVLLVGALLGDAGMTLGAAYRRGWLVAVRTMVLAALVWWPLSWLHQLNHSAAMGQADPLVWGLMAWDSLLVGIMACWAGTALHHAYREGPFVNR
jgi:hypothetical protein